MSNIEDRVKTIIAKKLDVDIEKVIPTASLTVDLGGDSIDLHELNLLLEDEFKISFPDFAMQQLNLVEDVNKLVNEQINNQRK